MPLLLLLACDQGKPAPPVVAPPPPPPGRIRGHVKFVLHGPGRNHGIDEGFDRESDVECAVKITPSEFARRTPSATPSRDELENHTVEAHTDSKGAYEIQVPKGAYDVSFADCGCDPRDVHVDVAAGSAATADWTCEEYAK